MYSPGIISPLFERRGAQMESLERKLGYAFHDRSLLSEALNHSSYANEHRGGLRSNERLEFLGDRPRWSTMW